jgi:tetratricopeptide (TPR) repeat protein
VWLSSLAPVLEARPAQQPDPAAAVLVEARGLIDTGRAASAVEKLAGLAAAGDARVRQLLGVAYYHADDPARAVETLAPLLASLPEGSLERREAEQVLGLSLYLTGRLAGAVTHLERTREWAGDNLELAHVLGMAYAQTQQPDKARAAYATLYRVPADSAPAHVLAAQMMIRVQLEDMAEAELRQAVAKDSRVPRAHYLLGQLALFRGRFAEAAALTEKELALDPGDAYAYAQLGDALVRQERWDEATAALQRSIWLNPYYSAPYILLGRAYLKKGQPATAEGMLRRALESDPNNRLAHYLLAQTLQQLGRADEARREFEAAERLPAGPGR